MKVPRSCFRGPSAEPVPEEQRKYGEVLRTRYPWIKETTLKVIFKEAREEMLRVLDEETGGISTSKALEKKGDLEGAISALKKHLEEDPDDPDAWYRLGELLCRAGRKEEGYTAFSEGRKRFRGDRSAHPLSRARSPPTGPSQCCPRSRAPA